MQEGFWSWLSGVTDNSVYPVMFMSYLDIVVPHLDNGWRRYLILFVVSVALAYLNYRYAVPHLPFTVHCVLAGTNCSRASFQAETWQGTAACMR